ncbi:dermonecrotic toxin domain-containing protein [Pseudomonas cedrina]|uniref:dermonecrotic toxin domain-containing protein n=1 Tax=Pseudomonas cedrina TaxID=651740 RepID=UPI003EDAD6AE
MPDTPAVSALGEPLTADYEIIKDKMPAWLPATHERNRQTFRRADTGHVAWLTSLGEAQRTQLKHYNEAAALSQQAVDEAMAPLQDVDTFARPLLQQALKTQYKVQLDVDRTFVHLRKPLEIGTLGIRAGDFAVQTLSLLQAALHNFEASECEPGAFDRSSRFRSGPQTDAAPVDTVLNVADFLALCRRLDIGAKYQTFLKDFLLPADTAVADALQRKVVQAQKDALLAAAYLALLKNDIGSDDYRMISEVVAGRRDVRADGKPVWFSDLSIMGLRLHGCTVFVPVEKYGDARQVLLYIPHDPQQPLKKYDSAQAMEEALTRQLMAGAVGARLTPYQQFILAFLAYSDQPTYFRRLTQDAPDAPGDPFAVWRSPITRFVLPFVSAVVTITLEPRELPPKPQAPRVPIESPNFYIRVLSKGELWDDNIDLFPDNFVKLRDKLIADARSHAVPTADVDARVRAEKIAALESAGLLALNLVSMLVPGLGEVMMAVMAAQLLYETFEGVIEWHEGDREAALAHLTDVAENLALIGVMAAGGAALGKVLKAPAVLDGVKPVTLASGERKLWKTDLTPYKAPVRLDPESTPDALGLHEHFGDTVLPHEGDHYLVKKDPQTEQYRIEHPTRRDAYAPLLEHNHEGGWQHEGEEPLTWDDNTLLRRLGQPADGLSSERLQQARLASGVDSETLRAGHVDVEPVPLALSESLKRLRIKDELKRFVTQMKSADPAVYGQADVGLQMDLLLRRGMLADVPPWVFESSGRKLWGPGSVNRSGGRAVVLKEGGVQRGELLQEVLYTLQGVDPALPEFPGRTEDSLAHRAGLLRGYLADQVEIFQDMLAQERYQARAGTDDPGAIRLIERYPGLPASMAEHLLKGAGAEELHALRTRGELPETLDAHAWWYAQEDRVARAYEGLFDETPSTLDSQRLALRTLETLPGWRRGSRVELRHHSQGGELLDAIGSPDANNRRTLVLRDNGLFEGPMPRDFYTATWHLLSAEERQAMGVSEVAQLKSQIRQSPLPRAPLRTVLAEHPVRKPAYDPSMRLLGGGPGLDQWVTQAGNLFRTPQARARRLFPSLGDAGVAAFIESLGTDVRGSLSRLEAEYQQLKQDLHQWTLSGDETVGALAREIKRCWRRQTNELTITPKTPISLPALSADFSHVETLELKTIAWNADAQTFLSNFKRLKVLRINSAGLTEVPPSIGQLSDLTRLSLRSNSIRLTPQSIEQLGSLRALRWLDLGYNRLGLAPDFSAQPKLESVDLSNSQLEQWPLGLGTQTKLTELNLRNNRLTSIPLHHLEPAPEQLEAMVRINRATAITHNPGLLSYGDVLDRYWRNLQAQHPELVLNTNGDNFAVETPLIAKAQRLFPGFNIKQAREYIWSLGEGGEALLIAREQALATLTDQLNAWAFSGDAPLQRYVRTDRLLANAATRDDRYLARARILSCWKRDMPQQLAFDRTPIGYELDLSGLRLPSLPDLDADFDHVASLRLDSMGLRASPEGFLARFRGLRWLDMTNNRLRELPPAIGEMHQLTRLFLHRNLIRLTPQTAQILAERVTLRALSLDGNPLGVMPNLGQISDLRTLSLSRTGIDRWPEGVGEQPLLTQINLSGNAITHLPDAIIAPSDAQLARSAQVSAVTELGNNPLAEETLQQVRDYHQRLQQAGLPQPGSTTRLVATALGESSHAAGELVAGAAFERWTSGLTDAQRATRRAQWLALRAQPGSDGFMRMLGDLDTGGAQHADLQGRVWDVIDTISPQTEAADALRGRMFDWAGAATCCDRAALSFSNVEIMAMVHKARLQAGDQTQGLALMKLSRGLFRLDEVEKTALADIQKRTETINNQPGLTPLQRRQRIEALEEVEIRLAYRLGLKAPDRLDLPAQAQGGRFTGLARVSEQTLDETCKRILALDGSPEEFQALVSRDFWQEYLTQKYPGRFQAMSQPFHDQMTQLHEKMDAGDLSASGFEGKSNDLQGQLAIAEATLIETLTRAEQAALNNGG